MNNKSIFRVLALSLLVILGAASCAKESSEDSSDIYKRIREAWININCPGLKPTESGIYILEKEVGSGDLVEDSAFVYVYYSAQTLDGTYSLSSTPELAKRLGTYSDTTYYSPSVWRTGVYSLYDCFEELLKGMRVGGHVKAVVPPELTKTTYPEGAITTSSLYGYTTTESNAYSNNMIFTLDIDKVVYDMEAYQIEELEKYGISRFGEADSLCNGFYMHKIDSLPERDTITDGAKAYVRYVGKLLDGYLFDTNIADTARMYRRYNSSSSYDKLSVTVNYDKSSFDENNSLISGFWKAVTNMRFGEHAVIYFTSDYGYTYEGSGSIPAYAPLTFEIWVDEEED